MSAQHPISNLILNPDERLDDLQNNGFRIIQKKNGFRFGTDAVLLSDFVKLRKRDCVMDLGTGTGIIAILLAIHHPEIRVDAVELQAEIANMAMRSVLMNGLSDRIAIRSMDLKNAPGFYGHGSFDSVVCNPPYSRENSSIHPSDENRKISRIECGTDIDQICECAKRLLKSGGRFSAIFPARRMLELTSAMERERLMPKRLRTVHAGADRAPRLILVDAVKDGASHLEWLPPLLLSNEDGTCSEELKRIYGQ